MKICLKTMFIYYLLVQLFTTSACQASESTNSFKGLFSIELSSPVASHYYYNSSEVIKEFPVFSDQSLNDKYNERDRYNYFGSVGYYFSDQTKISLDYRSGITEVIFELKIVELNVTHHFYYLTNDISLFAVAGIARHRLNDSSVTQNDEFLVHKTSIKAGVGTQWNYSDSWSIKLGSSFYNFMSMKNHYLNFEYRF